MNHIIGATLIERDGKYLLVQEAGNSVDLCKGKWGVAGGHVEIGETIMDGAIREAKEETGCDVELTGISQIGTMTDPDYAFIVVVFSARVLNEVENFTSNETSSVKWFTYEEIVSMADSLRTEELVLGAIENFQNGLVAPLDLIAVYPPLGDKKNLNPGE